MENMYRDKALDLEKENIELRKKVKTLEDTLYSKLGTNRFFTKNVEKVIVEFISSCITELQIVTLGFDSNFAKQFQKLAENEKKVQIITLERHLLKEQDVIGAFDQIQSSTEIKVYPNQHVHGNVLIKDKQEVLISSSKLRVEDLKNAPSFCIITLETQTVEQFQKYFNNHLPAFMRSS